MMPKKFLFKLVSIAAINLTISLGSASAQAGKPDEWALNNAQIGPDSPIEVPIGGSYKAQVVYPVPDGPLYPLKADVTWWIEPAVKGIFIEAKSGVITVADSVPHGTTATVYADLPGRRSKVSGKLYVFSPRQNPIVGAWRVESLSHCRGEENSRVESPLAGYQWHFRADQQFFIGRPNGIAARIGQTGTYHFDVKSGKLKLKPTWPKDAAESDWKIDREGDFSKLDLRSTREQNGHGTACGYVLASAGKHD